MEVKCKKCGRPLHDPVSIARGMCAKCAGLTGSGKSFRASRYPSLAATYASRQDNPGSLIQMAPLDNPRDEAVEIFKQFPSDLVNLVLRPRHAARLQPNSKRMAVARSRAG